MHVMTQQEMLHLLVNPQKRICWQIKTFRDNPQGGVHKIELICNRNYENSIETMTIKQSNKNSETDNDLKEIKSLLEQILQELKRQS